MDFYTRGNLISKVFSGNHRFLTEMISYVIVNTGNIYYFLFQENESHFTETSWRKSYIGEPHRILLSGMIVLL